ncbi:MAG TPA: hypothetical protein VKZ72_00305 [Acidimicrobiales bacterium]|nr:hypothetical protein [Acidimicrobiales bacterium]
MGRYYDFDAAWAEATSKDAPEPVRVKAFGREWALHAQVPAAAILIGARLMEGGDRELTDPEVIAFAQALLPEQVYEAWISAGISVEQLRDVLAVIVPLYMGPGGDQEGEAEAAQQEGSGSSPQSSPAGRRSKRTGSGSTASRSRRRSTG